MLQHTLYIGLNDKDTKNQQIATIDAMRIIENLFSHYEMGATLKECRGIYTHDDGAAVIENTIEAFTLEATDESIKALANDIKKALNQESILVKKETVNTEFI